MSDVIRLLPDSVANQIAAGEVVQRPASVLKELVENAIDAGATKVDVYLKDAGKTQIQVIDNGSGMSETDARLAFERHATSKIRSSDDLFSLHTFGFRGEALASICAVAEVQLRTRRGTDELGTQVDISASRVTGQQSVQCAAGSIFTVKNLFFNVPARRKFLKSDEREMKYILDEFRRITLVHEDVAFSLHNNGTEIYQLKEAVLRGRIIQLIGSRIDKALLPITAETTLVTINGFVTLPSAAKKSRGEQFFFANGRYINSPYLHKAMLQAYEGLLPPDQIPGYFIYLTVPPDTIDINIHPTKTEVKFEDERAIYQFLVSTVKQSLGKYNVVPAIDFDTSIQIAPLRPGTEIRPPSISINTAYNPFHTSHSAPPQDWEKLYQAFEEEKPAAPLFAAAESESSPCLQLQGRYIVAVHEGNLLVIDQKRAHERILFERYKASGKAGFSQQSMFPEEIVLSHDDLLLWQQLKDDFAAIGFDVRVIEDTKVGIYGHPSDVEHHNPAQLFTEMLDEYRHTENDLSENRSETLALLLAKATAIPYGQRLTDEEMRRIVKDLMVCRSPSLSPSGKAVMRTFTADEIRQFF